MRIPLLILAAAALFGQKPPPTTSLDSEQASARVVTEQPHRPTALHDHKLNRIQIFLDDGEMQTSDAAGRAQRITIKAGQVRWSPAGGPHISENISDHPLRIVEIELKNRPNPAPAGKSDLDPLKVDPKHYKLEFENDQVRVARVRFGPLEKGVMHEHTLNHIVVYMNDQARGQAGTMRLDAPETHAEE